MDDAKRLCIEGTPGLLYKQRIHTPEPGRKNVILFSFDTTRRKTLRALLAQNPGFLDAAYYVATYPEAAKSKLSPLEHYIRHGSRAGLKPNGIFDPATYAGTPGAGQDHASHYLGGGWKSHKPHRLFDPAYYAARYQADLPSGEEPLSHYLRQGWKQGNNPNLFFDVGHYLNTYKDIAAAGLEPLQHYIASGAREARRPNALFKPDQYIQTRIGETVLLEDALVHFADAATPQTRQFYDGYSKIQMSGRVGRVDDFAVRTGQKLVAFPHKAEWSWKAPLILNRDTPRVDIHATLPKPYVAVLKDAIAFPGTRLVIAGSRILHDELAEDRAPQYHDKLQSIGSYKDGIVAVDAILLKDRFETAVLISSDIDFNYFHMLVEALPKLLLAEQAGCPADAPILVQENLHKNILEAVHRVANGRPVIEIPVGAGVTVGELWYVSDLSRVLSTAVQSVDVTYDIVVAPDAVRGISRRIAPDRKSGKASRKVYLARISNRRLLHNEADLIALMKDKGFEVVDTASMDLQQQIDLFDEAAVMIAPTGASLTNLLWCQPGASALILVPDHPQTNVNIFNHIGNALGVEVEFCIGDRMYHVTDQYSVHDNFEIDLNVISEWCDRQDARRLATG